MKIAIFGASGSTGLRLIEQAIERGYSVTAFVRDSKRMMIHHDHLTILEGSVFNTHEVELAIQGQDAVIVALGANSSSPADICAKATLNIVNGMKKHQVKRIIVLTGFGTSPASRRQLGCVMRIVVKTISLLMYREFTDKEKQDEVVRQSGLNWTIVQPPKLTDGLKKGEFKHGSFRPSMLAQISRSDVATFMLDEVEHSRYINQSTYLHD
ncbi:NAD(P)-dependent oxidoreductase [Paenibacillus paeoniae]|uniref:NAD-dependent epimerase/dehydratase family protein n=1 Tax=Paenibacillus paeoniae TaxID=2292705 RepID=A0A371PL57_9BACL|nr:SDR family oxidoreductase [Paenibacillus paeoniae]REK76931.1 NAD-dependent epimerase/dehydratase family protein [Paenibacillus paeoniae]